MTTAIAPRPLRAAAIAGALLAGLLPATASASSQARLTDGGATVAAPSASTIMLTPIAKDLSKPVFITAAHDGTGRLFIVEKTGTIRVLDNGSVLTTPLLDISGSVSKGDEQGLLGLALHPNFKTNHRFFVDFTNTSGDTIIREYRTSTSNPNRVAAGSARTILKINQPFDNHNGGMIGFGPDHLLYIGMGDGGSGGDPGNRAQNKDKLLGKMLRINVNRRTKTRNYGIPQTNPYVGKPGRDEIWQRGLRNPWRWSFDSKTDNLWIGDVGQNNYEEVDRAVNRSSGAGRGFNWGWHVMEGFHCYEPSTGCNKSGKVKPLLNYTHASGRCAVTGGYVYRGSAIPALVGYYVFGDFCSGDIWAVRAGAASPASKIHLLSTNVLVSSFGEDGSGELYVVGLGGTIYRIDPA